MTILANLNHPHIVEVVELLEDDENYYVVQELVRNGELADIIFNKIKVKKETLTVQYVAKLLRQVFYAVAHMHGRGMVHRDLKPQNILMQDENTAKLADFGFAIDTKTTKIELYCSTPAYEPPEMIQ